MERTVRAWATWAALTVTAATLWSAFTGVQAYTAWSGRRTRQTGIDSAFDFAFSFGSLLLLWIIAAAVFAAFVGRARRSEAVLSRGAAPGTGIVRAWAVTAVIAVYVGLFFLIFMSFATPNRGMAGETIAYAFVNLAVAAVAGVLGLIACTRVSRALRASGRQVPDRG